MKQDTFTKNAGLTIEEPLIFERQNWSSSGVDIPNAPNVVSPLDASSLRKEAPELPGLSEPEAVRHFTRLSQKNFGIDTGMFPLGSCTMKHNPRLNEKIARLPGFSQVHPLQPLSSVQGSLSVLWHLTNWLKELTGMAAVDLTPAAGAHGELCGLFFIKKALQSRGELEKRTTILVPDSAHGTNPATAAQCGFQVESIPSTADGILDIEKLKVALNEKTAALMLTNPNTCGLFEKDSLEIADLLHKNGSYYYCDGANFNALLGQVKPRDLGIDVMHINLHKTFSTPHGGGGPGSGPVVMTEELKPFSPTPFVQKNEDGSFYLVENNKTSLGRIKSFHGQMGMFIRALSYMMSHGIDGLKQVSADAVLNATYLQYQLKDTLGLPFSEPCMHEALFDDRSLRQNHVETLDLAKILEDEGFHPMTTYFPLVVQGAMLIEPTETESKEQIDLFIATIKYWVERCKTAEGQKHFKEAPFYTPRRRFDEAGTARNPKLRWKKERI